MGEETLIKITKTIKGEDKKDSRETGRETIMAEDRMIPTIEIAIGAMITEGTRISMTIEEISMTIVAISRMGRVIRVGTAQTRASRNIEGIDTGEINKAR